MRTFLTIKLGQELVEMNSWKAETTFDSVSLAYCPNNSFSLHSEACYYALLLWLSFILLTQLFKMPIARVIVLYPSKVELWNLKRIFCSLGIMNCCKLMTPFIHKDRIFLDPENRHCKDGSALNLIQYCIFPQHLVSKALY